MLFRSLHVGLGKRKLTKEVAVGNDTAPKKRLLDQVRTLISKGGKVSLENTSFPPLERSGNRRRKYRKASKHASRLKASKLNRLLDKTASLPAPRSPTFATPCDKRKTAASHSVFNSTSNSTSAGYDPKARRPQQTSLSAHRGQRSR